MNLFTVLLPYLIMIGAIFFLKPFMSISKKLAKIFGYAFFPKVQMGAEPQGRRVKGAKNHNRLETVIRIIIFGLFIFIFLSGFLYFAQFLILPKNTENYQTLIKNANTVIVLGFGIEESNNGHLAAGISNDSIMKWVTENTNSKFIIAQKGCELSGYQNPNSQVVEMHPHGNKYVNTFEAAKFAMQKLDSLKNNKLISNSVVVLVAHNYQLERTAWIVDKLSETKDHKSNYQFIIPKITQIPFSSNSSQIHTKNKYLYMLVEMFISRPRDYFGTIFLKK
jgi:hypothetical protein